MKDSDSREYRNCQNFDYMDFTIQETRASNEHQRAIDDGLTCIDCHQGIAHKLPKRYLERHRQFVEEVEGGQSAGLGRPSDRETKEIETFLAKVRIDRTGT